MTVTPAIMLMLVLISLAAGAAIICLAVVACIYFYSYRNERDAHNETREEMGAVYQAKGEIHRTLEIEREQMKEFFKKPVVAVIQDQQISTIASAIVSALGKTSKEYIH